LGAHTPIARARQILHLIPNPPFAPLLLLAVRPSLGLFPNIASTTFCPPHAGGPHPLPCGRLPGEHSTAPGVDEGVQGAGGKRRGSALSPSLDAEAGRWHNRPLRSIMHKHTHMHTHTHTHTHKRWPASSPGGRCASARPSMRCVECAAGRRQAGLPPLVAKRQPAASCSAPPSCVVHHLNVATCCPTCPWPTLLQTN